MAPWLDTVEVTKVKWEQISLAVPVIVCMCILRMRKAISLQDTQGSAQKQIMPDKFFERRETQRI